MKSKLQTITKLTERRLPTNRPPTHPGEMLLEEFLKPLGISQSAFAMRTEQAEKIAQLEPLPDLICSE